MTKKIFAGCILAGTVILLSSLTSIVGFQTTQVPFTLEETEEITISEFKPDGTVEKTTVKLSKEKALGLAKQLKHADDPEEWFLLYKEYGLIPEDVTRGQLRQKMLRVAERLGITREKIESICKRPVHKRNGPDRFFAANFLNEMSGIFIANLNLPIGLSLITGIINYKFDAQGKDLLPSADLLYAGFSLVGLYWFYNGVLPDFCFGVFCAFLLGGFVGYVISYPFFGLAGSMYGFTVASLAIGPVYMGSPWLR